MTITNTDLAHLKRCVDLAEEALDAGDEPFGSVLVNGSGSVLFEDRNRVKGGDHTRHPEFEIARWAARHQTPEERAASTVYTSGEHCPMCAAAHGWVGLGRIVVATTAAQLSDWVREWGFPPAPVSPLPIAEVVPSAAVDGPVTELMDRVKSLQRTARFRPEQAPHEPTSVGAFELERYLGQWFEIGRLPLKYEDAGSTDVTASYELSAGGEVVVDNRCRNAAGEPVQALGKATPDENHAGRLKVSFLPAGLRWIPFTDANYWVLKLDAEYRTALVGTPDHKHLWLLSREPHLDAQLTEEYLVEATVQGYDLRDWIRPAHTGSPVTDAEIEA